MTPSETLTKLLVEREPLESFASRPSYHWLVVGTVCIGAFIGQLDASIMSLVLPTLEVSFHSPLRHVQWVALIYLLVLTGLLIPLGRLADGFGRKALYTLGFLLFIAGSALCGFAPDLPVLIAARGLQAIGAAMLQANSVAIITAAVPTGMLGRAIGVQGVAQAIGLAVGPAVGGFLIGWLDWRWVFFINVPIGLAGSTLAWLVLPRSGARHAVRGLHVAGVLVLSLGVASLLLGLTFLGEGLVLFPLAIVLLGAFVVGELRSPSPLVAREVVRARGLSAGLVAALLSYTVLFGGLLAVPLLLERVFGVGAAHAGVVLTTVPLTLAVVAEAGGLMADRIGPRLPTVSGMALAVGGLMLLEGVRGGTGLPLFGGLALLGIGMGLFIPANNASIMQAAPRANLGLTGGLINMMRGLGASFGIALVGVAMMIHAGSGPSHVVEAEQVRAGVGWSLYALAAAAVLGGVLSIVRQRPAVASPPR